MGPCFCILHRYYKIIKTQKVSLRVGSYLIGDAGSRMSMLSCPVLRSEMQVAVGAA